MQPLKFWCHLAAIFTLAGRSEQIDGEFKKAHWIWGGGCIAPTSLLFKHLSEREQVKVLNGGSALCMVDWYL